MGVKRIRRLKICCFEYCLRGSKGLEPVKMNVQTDMYLDLIYIHFGINIFFTVTKAVPVTMLCEHHHDSVSLTTPHTATLLERPVGPGYTLRQVSRFRRTSLPTLTPPPQKVTSTAGPYTHRP